MADTRWQQLYLSVVEKAAAAQEGTELEELEGATNWQRVYLRAIEQSASPTLEKPDALATTTTLSATTEDRALTFREAFDRKTSSTLFAACCCLQLSAVVLYLPSCSLAFLSDHFEGDPVAVSWVASCLTLVVGGVSLFLGALTDSVGRRNVLLIGCVCSMVGMTIAATAHNITVVIVGASISAVGIATGWLAIPIAQELVPNRLRPFALTAANVFNDWPAIAAPCISGAIVSSGSWTWLFWTGLIFAGATFPVVWFLYRPPPRVLLVGATKTELVRKFDYVGMTLSLGGVVLFLVGLTSGEANPWASGRVLGPLVAGAMLLVALVPWELYGAKYPLLPRAILAERNVATTLGVTFVVGFLYYALVAFFPVCIGRVYGESPVGVGVLSLPWNVSFTVTMVASGVLVTRFRRSLKPTLIIASAFCTAFLGALSTINPTNKPAFVVFSTLVGAGLAPIVVLPSLAATLCTPPERIGTVSSLITVVRMLGGTIGITAFQLLLKARVDKYLNEQLRRVAGTTLASFETLLAMSISSKADDRVLVAPHVLAAADDAVKMANAQGFRWLFVMAAGLSACALLACFAFDDIAKHLNNHIAAGVHMRHADAVTVDQVRVAKFS